MKLISLRVLAGLFFMVPWNAAVLAAGPTSSLAPVATAAAPASFESCEIQARGMWPGQFVLRIQADGSLQFERTWFGGKKLDPPYVATYRLSQGDLAEFVRLLAATSYLKTEVPKGAAATDQTEWSIRLTRVKGDVPSPLTFEDPRSGPYASLILFLERLERQEDFAFKLQQPDSRLEAIREIMDELESVQGAPSHVQVFTPVLDYSRFSEAMADRIGHPARYESDEVEMAAKIAGRMRLESQRTALEALALGKPLDANGQAPVMQARRGAVKGLGYLGPSPSLPALEKLVSEADLGDALTEAAARLQWQESLSLLAQVAEVNQGAADKLVGFGAAADEMILDILKKTGDDAKTTGAGNIIRAYVDHWDPKQPPSAALMAAIRVRANAAPDGSNTQRYGKQLLELAAHGPNP